MKALQFHEYGGPEVLKIEDVPVPEPGPGEALVRVSGSGINPIDWKVREGHMKEAMPLALPATVGWEFSGTIEKLGDGVEGYEVGDDVYGVEHRGTCADYIVANPERVRQGAAHDGPSRLGRHPDRGPDGVAGLVRPRRAESRAEGAHPGRDRRRGHLRRPARQVGGAYVYATASASRLHTVQELGADRPIDYKAERFEEIATDVDLVLDLIGVRRASARSPA